MSCSQRTIILSKTNYFNSLRLGLKASLIANLLILGHILLTTSANSPISIHLLNENENENEKGMIFSKTWIECLSQFIVLLFWLKYWKDLELIIEAFSFQLKEEFILLPITSFSGIILLILLNLQIIISICLYTIKNGIKSLNQNFWFGRTGWWVGQIRLERIIENDLENGFIIEKS
ncbi:uncharacterized protein I206_100616 [Kwoniella pini CBS 10737]|uniref:Uncharacterized protein n=1 Tax=Kwoniella pini CBS 10737 TaxID=1296096 RepID=A0AAJ8MMN1_9TREE